MSPALQAILKSPVMHDSTRKERALKFVESRQGTCTYKEVQEKYFLEKKVIKKLSGGINKYGYYAGEYLVLTEYNV